MIIEEQDIDLIIGALDSLAVALADHGHKWTEGEREIYERSLSILLGQRPCHPAGGDAESNKTRSSGLGA